MKKFLFVVLCAIGLVFSWHEGTVFADTSTKIEYQTKKLEHNDIKIWNGMTAIDMFGELVRQYYNSFPDYKGVVTAYTPSQYYAKESGESSSSIDFNYLRLVEKRRLIFLRGEVVNVPTSTFPNSAVGAISTYVSLPNGIMILSSPLIGDDNTETSESDDFYTASAFLLNPISNKIATAAHCLYVDGHYISGGTVLFGAGSNDLTAGQLTNLKVPDAWINSGDSDLDVGTASINVVQGSVKQGLTLSGSNPDRASATSLGYPASPYGDTYTLMSSSGDVYPAAKQPIDYYESQSVRGHHGMSGGPLLNTSNQVIGIVSYETHYVNADGSNGNEYEWGFRRITPAIYSFLTN